MSARLGALAGAAALLLLTGCAAAAPGADPSSAPAAPVATGAEQQARVAALASPSSDAPVLAIGAVLDAGTPVLCLGGMMESYPPQCHGPELQGWDWSLVDFEEASGVRWVEGVAVPVTFDGPAQTATVAGELLDLATLSMPAPEIPGGSLTDAELEALQLDLMEAGRPDSLGSYGQEGTLVWNVVLDDGTLQAGVDEIYGEGRIFVLSALLAQP